MVHSFHVPVKAVSEANARDNRWRLTKRKRWQRDWTATAFRNSRPPKIKPEQIIEIRLTRLGPRKLDSDNLAGSMKYIRDQIAKEIGFNDAADVWQEMQRPSKTYGVDVEIEYG